MDKWTDALKDIELQMDNMERALKKVPTDTSDLIPVIGRYNRLKTILYERKCQFLKNIFNSILMLGGAENFDEANHQIHRNLRPDVNRKCTEDDIVRVTELMKELTGSNPKNYYDTCAWLIKIRVISRLKALSRELGHQELEKVVTEFRQAVSNFS